MPWTYERALTGPGRALVRECGRRLLLPESAASALAQTAFYFFLELFVNGGQESI